MGPTIKKNLSDETLIFMIFVLTSACLVGGLIEFGYAIWFNSSPNNSIKKIIYDGETYEPTSMLGVYFNMPTGGAIQTIQPFVQALVIFVLYLKYKKLCSCKWNFIVFIILTESLFIIYLVVGIIALCRIPYFNTDLRMAIESSLTKNYQGYPIGYDKDDSASVDWDNVMLRQACCGVNGQADFIANGDAFLATKWRSKSMEYKLSNNTRYTDNDIKIPISCCKVKDGFIKSSGKISMSELQSNLLSETCPLDLSMSNTAGCQDKVVQITTGFVLWTQVLLIVIAIVYDSVVTMTIALFRKMRQETSTSEISDDKD